MKQKLIVNADDFGLTPGVNYGIVEAFKYGILTSTTLMINQPFAEHAIDLKKRYKNLGVGIHITFDKGKALTGKSSLTDENGILLKFPLLKEKGQEEDFYMEAKTQIEKFIELVGEKPTHIDSHHHIHMKIPGAITAIEKLSKEYNLTFRKNETLIEDFYGELVDLEKLLEMLNNKKSSTVELMCHPGYKDFELLETSSYNSKREEELKILKSPKVKEYIRENFDLIDYLGNLKEEI